MLIAKTLLEKLQKSASSASLWREMHRMRQSITKARNLRPCLRTDKRLVFGRSSTERSATQSSKRSSTSSTRKNGTLTFHSLTTSSTYIMSLIRRWLTVIRCQTMQSSRRAQGRAQVCRATWCTAWCRMCKSRISTGRRGALARRSRTSQVKLWLSSLSQTSSWATTKTSHTTSQTSSDSISRIQNRRSIKMMMLAQIKTRLRCAVKFSQPKTLASTMESTCWSSSFRIFAAALSGAMTRKSTRVTGTGETSRSCARLSLLSRA